MTVLSAELSAIVGNAFAAEGLSQSFGQVTRSDRPDLAQFQCNGALAAAKAAKANPRAVAQKIVARLKSDPLFAKVEIAGPGFINLDATDAALSERGVTLSKDARLGAPLGATVATRVRELKPDKQPFVRARRGAVLLDEQLTQPREVILSVRAAEELIRVGPALVPDRDRFAAPDELRAARAEVAPAAARQLRGAAFGRAVPALHRVNGEAIADVNLARA